MPQMSTLILVVSPGGDGNTYGHDDFFGVQEIAAQLLCLYTMCFGIFSHVPSMNFGTLVMDNL